MKTTQQTMINALFNKRMFNIPELGTRAFRKDLLVHLEYDMGLSEGAASSAYDKALKLNIANGHLIKIKKGVYELTELAFETKDAIIHNSDTCIKNQL